MHEVQVVTSGRRLVLAYNLCWRADVAVKPSAGAVEQQSKLMANALLSWDLGDSGALGLPLQHKYTQFGLSHSGVAALKGIDSVHFKTIQVF